MVLKLLKKTYFKRFWRFFGTNQSGLPKWRFFTPYEDFDFLEKTKINCKEILNKKNSEVADLLINIFYRKIDFTNFFSP